MDDQVDMYLSIGFGCLFIISGIYVASLAIRECFCNTEYYDELLVDDDIV